MSDVSEMTGLTERETAELFFAIPEVYRPCIEHWTLGPVAVEAVARMSGVDPCSFERMYRSCMDEIIGLHVNCRCVSPDPSPQPPIPRSERFDDWRKRTAALLEECAKEKR